MIQVQHPPMRWAEYDDDLSYGLIGCDAMDLGLEPEDITIKPGETEALPVDAEGLARGVWLDEHCWGLFEYEPGTFNEVGRSQFGASGPDYVETVRDLHAPF